MHDVVQTNPSSYRPVPRSVLLVGISCPHVDPGENGHQFTTLFRESYERKLRSSRQNLRSSSSSSSYLRSRSPPLVHHDLSTNNVLLNEVSLQAKVTDFCMTRAMDPFKMTRKSSAKGTQAFMPPEALHSPPRYDEKLDVFSYWNVIVTTVIHDWPEPGPPTALERGKIIGFSELQHRQQHLALFTPKENELFLPIVGPCLQNDPTMRPTSIQLVAQMRGIEESHPRRVEDSTVIPQLRQDLQLKDEQLREKDQQLRE